MATNAKSLNASRAVNDLFSKLGWLGGHGVYAYPTGDPNEVALQYKSEAHGCVRTVSAKPLELLQWLRDKCPAWGPLPAFKKILDRKEERPVPMQQSELNLGSVSNLARRSIIP